MGSLWLGRRKPLFTALKYSLALSAGLAAHSGAAEPPASCDPGAADYQDCQSDSSPPAAGSAADNDPRVAPSTNLDWVTIDQLREDQRSRVRPNCCGAYLDPPRDYPDSARSPEGSALRVSADSTEAQGRTATLEGDVQVSQGYRQVRSDRAELDQDQRTVKLEGNVTFREPGVLFTGDTANVNLESGQVAVQDVVFVLHDSGVRGEAGRLSRPEENRIYIDDVTYTTCEPGSNSWQLRASSVDIDTASMMATARNMRLNVRDVPVVYLPWIRFPVSDNRATGLLFPTIFTGNDNGLDYAQPIYLNLAPNYDATLTPRYIQERGAMAEVELRHLSTRAATALTGGYLPDDKGGSGSPSLHEGDSRWTASLQHQGGWGARWSTLVDYSDVSDIDYFRDIDSATLAVSSTSHLNQQLKLGYLTDNWDLAVQAQEFETLIVNGLEQYQQVPRVDANGHYRLRDSDIVLTLKQNYVNFDHSQGDVFGSGTPLTTDSKNTTVTGARLRADYSLTWDKEWLWGFFKPALTAKYVAYDLDNPLLNQSAQRPDILVPVTSLDTGLYFERDHTRAAGHIQTLEPRLYYLNASHKDQSAFPNFDTSDLTFGYHQLFRDDRFSGGDRIGDTEQVTLGITSRRINAGTGEELIRFSIGQVYYMADRRVTLVPQDTSELSRDSSDIAAELGGVFADNWRYQADLLTNEDGDRINKGNLSLRYNNQNDTVFNFSYRYTRRENVLLGNQFVRADIDQADFSLAIPISASWTILGRYNQDLRTNQELEVFAGLEYASCCWRASIVARRWIDRDDNYIIGDEDLTHNNGVFFQIQFRGLAGTGKRVDNILREGIYGYQPPEN